MIHTVDVEPHDLLTARTFAAKSVSSSIDQYARRRQTDPRQIQHQIEIGKIGEFAVYSWLRAHGLHLSAPDVAVYDARHKTFAPDLQLTVQTNWTKTTTFPIHVKAQDAQSAERFGASWTFQYSASAGSDKEIFAPNPTGFVAFVGVRGNSAVLYGMPFVKTLFDYDLFRDPKLAKLRGIKTVVYYDDFKLVPEADQWRINEYIKIYGKKDNV